MGQLRKENRDGQSIMEYTIVLGAIVLILVAMTPYVKRVIQGTIKLTADQIGFQENADQDFDAGYLNVSYVTVDTITDQTTQDVRGTMTYTYGDAVNIQSNAFVDLGFIEAPTP